MVLASTVIVLMATVLLQRNVVSEDIQCQTSYDRFTIRNNDDVKLCLQGGIWNLYIKDSTVKTDKLGSGLHDLYRVTHAIRCTNYWDYDGTITCGGQRSEFSAKDLKNNEDVKKCFQDGLNFIKPEVQNIQDPSIRSIYEDDLNNFLTVANQLM